LEQRMIVINSSHASSELLGFGLRIWVVSTGVLTV
jgi:hypothetical protein